MRPEETVFWTMTMLDNGISGDVARRLLMKMVRGSLKYGSISENMNTRDFASEILDELYDAANYCIIQMYEKGENDKFKSILKEVNELITKIRKI